MLKIDKKQTAHWCEFDDGRRNPITGYALIYACRDKNPKGECKDFLEKGPGIFGKIINLFIFFLKKWVNK